MRIGNYGNWHGDQRGNKPGSGNHPPACTCVACVERNRRQRQRPSRPANAGNRPSSRPSGPSPQPSSRQNSPDRRRNPKPKPPKPPKAPKPPRPPREPRPRSSGSGESGGGCACLVIIIIMLSGIGVVAGLAVWGPDQPIFSPVKTVASANPTLVPPPTLTPAPTLTLASPAAATPGPTATPFLRNERDFVAAQYRGAAQGLTQAVSDLRAAIPSVTIPELGSEGSADASPRPTPTPVPTVADRLTEIGTIAMRLANEARAERGLPPLETSPKLVEIATQHSGDMASQGYFSHDSPEGSDYLRRYREGGFPCGRRVGRVIHQGAENIYQGWASNSLTVRDWRIVTIKVSNGKALASEAVREWMQSPGHRANLLHPVWRQQGIGAAVGTGDRVYLTHNFC